MLRHYAEKELLLPVKIDEETGYRYYSEDQLMQAGRIQMLRNMGFGLSVVREIMDKFTDAGELEQFLRIKMQELKEQEYELKQQLRLLDSTINWLRKDGNIMGYDVNLKTMEERYVASVRQVVADYGSMGLLWQVMVEETSHMNIQNQNPAYNLAIFHDGEYKEHDVDIEIQKCVSGVYQDTEHVRFKTMPAVLFASVTFTGSYDQITPVNESLAHWIRDNGYEFDGESFNIYHAGPHQVQNQDDFVTEVCYPVRKK